MKYRHFAHNFLLILFGITLISGFFVVVGFADKGDGEQVEKDPENLSFPAKYVIRSVPVPEEIEFAGEPVPVHFKDVYESLDREVLINTYWQSQTVLFIKRAYKYFPIIEKILKEEGVPEDFKYLPLIESGFLDVVSPMGATGVWQFLEGTARDYGLEVNATVDERYHIEKSTVAACRFLKDSYKQYNSWTMAAASYNVGRRGIANQIDRQKEDNYYNLLLNIETGRYVYRLVAVKLILTNPHDFGFFVEPDHKYNMIDYVEVSVDTTINDVPAFAAHFGTNYKVLKVLNPWMRDTYLPNRSGKKYLIKIPTKNGRLVDTPKYE